jgi:hypothetical protein
VHGVIATKRIVLRERSRVACEFLVDSDKQQCACSAFQV